MADKLTQQITDALSRAAAEPAGLPLYASKSDPGLFPNTAAAKPAAQKCLADDLISARPAGAGKRELYALTEKGWAHLLAAVNPKQVLEDFVRVLEARQGAVGELLESARSMADSLQGLKDAVARVLPGVTAARIAEPTPPKGRGELSSPSLLAGEGGRAESWRAPLDGTQPRPGEGALSNTFLRSSSEASTLPLTRLENSPPSPARGEGEDNSPLPFRGRAGAGLFTEVALAPAAVAYLRDRSAATDCPLPELFRALARDRALTIGEFHDTLRQLCADGQVVLNAWTGPLYAIPEPQFALLSGHSIAYFASLRN